MATASTNGSSKTLQKPGAILGAAVAGIAVGLVANLGRKAIVQGVTASTGDWAEGLKAEHKATLKLFDLMEQTDEKQTSKRKTLLLQIKHALSKHAYQEENVVYPAMRTHGLSDEADHLNHDHGYVKQYLYELAEMKPDNTQWLAKVSEFRTDLEKHIREEEEDLFPKLHADLGKTGNAHVTKAMNKEGFLAA